MKKIIICIMALTSLSTFASPKAEITDKTTFQGFNSAGGEYKMIRVEDKEKKVTCYIVVLENAQIEVQVNSKPTISCIKD